MIALAFYSFLRPPEYCVTTSNHNICWEDVRFSKGDRKIRLTLKSFKHSQGRRIVQVESAEVCCPVTRMRRYKKLTKTNRGSPVFDVTATEFRRILRTTRKVAGIKRKLTPHALRHGGATWGGRQGWPDARIKAHGRWNSDAYKRYVRGY